MSCELGCCSQRGWACPVRCHPLGAGPGEKRSGATLASTSANLTHPADVQAPTSDLSSPHARPSSHYTASHHGLSRPTASLPSRKPSENTSVIHIAVAVAVPSGHWEEIRRPRPLSSDRCTGRGDPRDSLSAPLSNSSQPNRQRLHLTPRSPHLRHLHTRPQTFQQRTFLPGQMRSNRAPHTVLQ